MRLTDVIDMALSRIAHEFLGKIILHAGKDAADKILPAVLSIHRHPAMIQMLMG